MEKTGESISSQIIPEVAEIKSRPKKTKDN
jgi:hypothetical protein